MFQVKIWSWQTYYHDFLQEKTSPIELHQNIQTLHYNHDCLNLVRGVIEKDPVHATVYRLTLNSWPNRIRDVLHTAHHFWSIRDELTIEEGVCLKGYQVCIPSELNDRTI